MRLDLDCVAGFVVLVEEGSYKHAAAHLHLTPSALTRRIQRLERQVGAQLLVRGPDGVIGPTAAGWRFEARARSLLAASEAARAAVHDRGEPVIHLGVPGPIGDFPERRYLAEVARQLRLRHPHVRLVCRSVALEDTHRSLLEGTVDVFWGAYCSAPLAVELTPMLQLDRIAVTPSAHDLADAGCVSAAELAERPLLYIPAVPAVIMHPFVLGDVRPPERGRLIPTDALDSRTIMGRLRPGQAVVISESSWPASFLDPGLKELRISDIPPVDLYAACRRSDRRATVRSLVEILPAVAQSLRTEMRQLWASRSASIVGNGHAEPHPDVGGRIEQYVL